MQAQSTNRRFHGPGWLFRRPRTAFWWCGYYRNAKLYRESTHTADEREARRFLQRRMAEVASDNFIAPQTAKITLEELAEDLFLDYHLRERKSRADVKARWNLHLKPKFGHLRANSITSSLIAAYVVDRQKQGASNATINRELAALKRMFNLGYRATPLKVHRVPAFPRLTERNVRKGFVEDQEYIKLSEAAARVGLWLRALLEVGHTYGWRVSELLNLQVNQLDLLNRAIRLNPGETKNDDGRVVIMTNKVHQLLTQCAAGKQPSDFVFTRENGKPVRDFRGTWEKICTEAGAPERLFHDLRRTAVRNMVRAGIPERVAMQISGHRTRAIFDRYHIVSENDLREAASKMERMEQPRREIVQEIVVTPPSSATNTIQ